MRRLACAIEMHFNMSQEPLCTEIYRKNAAAQNQPRMQTHTLCKPVQSKCTATCHKSHFVRKFTGKMPQPKTTAHTLCEPKSDFIRKFPGKMPRPRLSPERRHTLCASLRSRNACQNFTRVTLYGNLHVKCRRPE